MIIKYSPDASDKLRELKKNAGIKTVSIITKSIRGLEDNPHKGASVEGILGISNPYYFLHVEQNYVFYSIDSSQIYILDIYSERENFMWKMFGISLRTQESIDFWKE